MGPGEVIANILSIHKTLHRKTRPIHNQRAHPLRPVRLNPNVHLRKPRSPPRPDRRRLPPRQPPHQRSRPHGRQQDAPRRSHPRSPRRRPAPLRRKPRPGIRRTSPPSVATLPDAEFHLIGPLQSNKTTRAAELFHAIDTVDSLKHRPAPQHRRRRPQQDAPHPHRGQALPRRRPSTASPPTTSPPSSTTSPHSPTSSPPAS